MPNNFFLLVCFWLDQQPGQAQHDPAQEPVGSCGGAGWSPQLLHPKPGPDPASTSVNNWGLPGEIFCQTPKLNANEFKSYWGCTTITIQHIPMNRALLKIQIQNYPMYFSVLFSLKENYASCKTTLQNHCYAC